MKKVICIICLIIYSCILSSCEEEKYTEDENFEEIVSESGGQGDDVGNAEDGDSD